MFLLLLLILGLSMPCLHAQQYPGFSQQLYDAELFQPARVGLDGDYAGVRYRDQWTGMDKRYSPVTFLAGADLSQTFNLTEKRIGLGFEMMGDRIFIQHSFFFHASFAYKLIETRDLTLSSGILAGWLNQRMDYDDTRIGDPFDLAVLEGRPSASGFSGGLGLHLRSRSRRGHLFQADLVMPQLFNSNLNFAGGSRYNPVPHLQIGLGYKLAGAQVVQLEPRLLLRGILADGSFQSTLDLGLRGFFLDSRYWAGMGVRLQGEAFHLAFGMAILEDFDLSVLMESQAQLGFSFELGIVYRLTDPPEAAMDLPQTGPLPPTTPDAPERTVGQLQEDFRTHYRQALVELENMLTLENALEPRLQRLENFYKLATSRYTTIDDRLLLARELENNMVDVQDDLASLRESMETAEEERLQAETVYDQARETQIDLPEARTRLRSLKKATRVSSRRARKILKGFADLEPKVRQLQGDR